ncbi:hypothetical protein N7454_010506 [Penicillium verhagenii]|nr:hypothetical protein N7454_010506 [Penicillium verhagenii]
MPRSNPHFDEERQQFYTAFQFHGRTVKLYLDNGGGAWGPGTIGSKYTDYYYDPSNRVSQRNKVELREEMCMIPQSDV